MTFKRIAVSLCTIMICMMLFIGGYMKSAAIYSFADSTTDEWLNVTTNEELVEAFKYYCKSRNLVIEGSLLDGVTKFTTNAFNGICNTLGVNVTALQAHIKYKTDGNNILNFLFDSTGISIYNRIFAEFLQNNNLSVGDNVDDESVFSGDYFTNPDNYTCVVYQTSRTETKYSNDNGIQYLTKRGTPLVYTSRELYNLYIQEYGENHFSITDYNSVTVRVTDSYSYTFKNYLWHTASYVWLSYSKPNSASSSADNYSRLRANRWTNSTVGAVTCEGNPAIIKLGNGKYYFGTVSLDYVNPTRFAYNGLYELTSTTNVLPNVNIYVTTQNNYNNTTNKTINNNVYEGDTTINYNGDVNYTPPDPEVPEYDPYPDGDPNPTPPTDVGGGSESDDTNITFPNFEFNFPEIDWSLGDLSQKFPFSIPFDLIAFFTVLNAEPQAPRIDANIPLGSWYTWHFTADFSQYDRYASLIRQVEFISFVVGLIYLTIRIVKG